MADRAGPPRMIETITRPTNDPLLTRPVLWFLLFSIVSNASLSLLFAALPLFAEDTTGNALAAGLTTGTMMLCTVLVELVTPRLMADYGYGRVGWSWGWRCWDFPALLLVAFPNLGTILLVAAARGAGLATSVGGRHRTGGPYLPGPPPGRGARHLWGDGQHSRRAPCCRSGCGRPRGSARFDLVAVIAAALRATTGHGDHPDHAAAGQPEPSSRGG